MKTFLKYKKSAVVSAFALAAAIIALSGIFTAKAEKSLEGALPGEPGQRGIFALISSQELSSNAYYKVYKFRRSRGDIVIHVIEADVREPDYSLAVVKAGGNTSEVKKLHDIVKEFDEKKNSILLGAVNGSFWRSYTNQPMGPTFIGGEAVELKSFKSWNSAFLDSSGKMHIGVFYTKCDISDENGLLFEAFYANRRENNKGVVVYNKYSGDIVPYVSPLSLRRAFEEALKDKQFKDKTDKDFDTLQFKRELLKKEKYNNYDYKAPKISLEYIHEPAVNKEIMCVVTGYRRSGSMPMPENGCVLTFGRDINRKKIPRTGDTIFLQYKTKQHDSLVFTDALCGTPRLVRNGIPDPETKEEGLRSRRFIDGSLRRTAIGANKDKSKVFLAAAEGGNSSKNITGADLKEMAYIMRRIGAYDALNLDGGGSTVMVIDDINVANESCPQCSRSISIAVGVARKKVSVKNLFDKIK